MTSRARASDSTTAKRSPASGTPWKPSTSTGSRRAGVLHLLAVVVDQGADAAPLGAGDDDVADLERAALDEHGRDRAAAAVELGLDHDAFGRPVADWP